MLQSPSILTTIVFKISEKGSNTLICLLLFLFGSNLFLVLKLLVLRNADHSLSLWSLFAFLCVNSSLRIASVFTSIISRRTSCPSCKALGHRWTSSHSSNVPKYMKPSQWTIELSEYYRESPIWTYSSQPSSGLWVVMRKFILNRGCTFLFRIHQCSTFFD